MAVGVLNRAKSNVIDEQYEIITLDGKIDSLEVLYLKYNHKSVYRRWDLKLNNSILKKALYIIAKHEPEKFRVLYFDLKNKDQEFFSIAKNVLIKIHNEYSFK